MTKKQKLLTVGLAAAGITTFGLVVGLASQANYNGQNPRARVNAELSQIKSVAFKNDFAPFTSDYTTLKNKLFDENGKLKTDVNLLDGLEFISTNNSVFNIPNGIKVEIEKFEPEDAQSRFKLQFHLSQQVHNRVANSNSYIVYLSQSDAIKNALVQYSDFVRKSFDEIKPVDLGYFKNQPTTSDEQVEKPLFLTQVSDFVDEVNKSTDNQEVLKTLSSHLNLNQIFDDINSKEATLPTQLGDKPFTIEVVKNPANEQQWASLSTDNPNAFDFWVKTSFSSDAQKALESSASKSDTIIQKIEVGKNANFFLDPQKIMSQVGIYQLSSLDFYRDSNQTSPRTDIYYEPLNEQGFQASLPTNFASSKVDSYKYDAFTFFNELQKISNQDDINNAINRLLIKGVRLNLGEYQNLPAELVKKYFRYDFLTKKASIKIGFNNRLYIDLPVRISLLDSVVGRDGSKAIASKEVKFDLDNFKPVEQSQLDALISENQDAKGNSQAKPLTSTQLVSADEITTLVKEKKFDQLRQLIASPNGYNLDLNKEILDLASVDAPKAPTIADVQAAQWQQNKNDSYQDQGIFSSNTSIFKSQNELAAFYRSLLEQGRSGVVNGLYKLATAAGLKFNKGQFANLDNLGSLSLSDLANIKIQNNNFDKDDDDNNSIYLFDVNGYFQDYQNSFPLYLPTSFKTPGPDFVKLVGNQKSYDQLTFADLDNSDANYKFRLLSFLNAYQFKRAQLIDTSKLIPQDSSSQPSGSSHSSSAGKSDNNNDDDIVNIPDIPGLSYTLPSSNKDTNNSSAEENATTSKSDDPIFLTTGPTIEDKIGQQDFIPNNFPFALAKKFDASKFYPSTSGQSDQAGTSNPAKHTSNYFALEKITSLKDLVVAFYLQAAANSGWSNKSNFGFKVGVEFKQGSIPKQGDKDIIQLNYWYKFGFQKENGEFVDDILKTKEIPLFLEASGYDSQKFEEVSNLDSTILNLPTQYTNLVFGENKFKLLKDTIEEKNKPTSTSSPAKPATSSTDQFKTFKVLAEGLAPYLKSLNSNYDFEIEKATLNSDSSAILTGKLYLSQTEPAAQGEVNKQAIAKTTTKIPSRIPLVITIVKDPNKQDSIDGLNDKLWEDHIVVTKAS